MVIKDFTQCFTKSKICLFQDANFDSLPLPTKYGGLGRSSLNNFLTFWLNILKSDTEFNTLRQGSTTCGPQPTRLWLLTTGSVTDINEAVCVHSSAPHTKPSPLSATPGPLTQKGWGTLV